VVGVLACLPLLLVTAPAQASTYRYWTYWWGSGTGKSSSGWTFAQVGPAGHRVNDTWVLGWRFSTTTSTSGGVRPRQSADFATLCPSLAAPVAGQDRVALVIDYGTTSDAPAGQVPPSTSSVRVECLTLASHPTGLGVLGAADVALTSKNGLVCSLDGYPAGECAPIVADPTPTPTAPRPATTAPMPSPTASRPAAPASSTASSTTTVGSAPTSASAASTAGGPTSSPEPAPASSGASSSTPPALSGASDEPTLPAMSGAPVASVDQGSTGPVGALVAAAIVGLLAGSAWWTARRGRRT
jgi:hypothetical protein